MNFAQRSILPEKMDDQNVLKSDVSLALKELEIVNKWLGGYAVIRDAFRKIRCNNRISILDIGCGSGDVVRDLSIFLKAKKVDSHITGVDINADTIHIARKKHEDISNVDFKTLDVWDEDIVHIKADIVMSSMFCHHFNDNDLVELLKRMYRLANSTVIINDLHRHSFAYHSIKILTSVFSKSHLVRYDAPLSVARALTKKEWQTILANAEINNYSIDWKWAWRWQIIIQK
jgi:ubiquinone/menaquinone biosynthesis C-methylase UbiE